MKIMNKSTLLKSVASAALIVVSGISAFAQNVAAPTAGAAAEIPNSDYVTVGSRVPYYVQTDATIQAMTTAGSMKESIFRWFVTTAGDVTIPGVPLLEYTGGAGQQYNDFRVVTPGTGYYDNEISLTWSVANGFAAGTQYKVKVAEKSVTLSPTIAGCEDLTPVEKPVFVLARPSVAFVGTEGGGCSVAPGSSFDVPITITGLGDWQVTYTMAYNGGAAGAPVTYTLTQAAPVVTDVNVVAESVLARNPAATFGLVVPIPALQYGYYDVAITNITDRTSRKSLDALAAAGAAGTFRVYVNPVPVTLPIQHLKNL
jgi:hypothetical protein